ncbi:uncharacterized protein EI90DRAFT_3086295, partial [Cantharellus anzutake]|uniref:uncharacterized protein n=1 Tax=Cantharellus anzutake TaxID=1750568 RepID=UPI0019062983
MQCQTAERECVHRGLLQPPSQFHHQRSNTNNSSHHPANCWPQPLPLYKWTILKRKSRPTDRVIPGEMIFSNQSPLPLLGDATMS